MPSPTAYAHRVNWGGRYFMAVLLGALGGGAWAVVENPRLSGRLQESLASLPPITPPSPAHPVPAPAPKSSVPEPSPFPVPATAALSPSSSATSAPLPSSATLSEDEVKSAMSSAREQLKKCRFHEAQTRLAGLADGRLPASVKAETVELKRRIGLYQDLIAETSSGSLQEMNKIAILTLAGGRQIKGTLVSETPGQITIRNLGGTITTTVRRDEERARDFFTEYETRKLLEDELENRLGRIRDSDPVKLFDAADFCIRSGLAERVVPTLDLAIDADTNLLQAVREERAYRMYQTFLFFLNTNSRDEAKATLDLLQRKYPKSKYVQLVGKEEEEYMAYLAEVEQKAAERATARAAAAPAGAKPKASGPVETAARRPGEDLFIEVTETGPDEPAEPTTGPAAEAKKIIDEGNAQYDLAITHLRESDPNRNPERADEENLEALKYFKKAFDLYIAAQEKHDTRWLQDRIRDTNFKRAGCMKRSVKR